jgi:hypothetical protein
MVFLILFLFFLSYSSVKCCDLADHDWQGSFKSFYLEWPFSIFAELELCSNFLSSSFINEIYFITNRSIPKAYFLFFQNLKNTWLSKQKIYFFAKNQESDSDRLTTKKNRAIIKLENYKIRIGYFKDKNANMLCKQIIFLQQGKMKILQIKDSKPQINSFMVRTWFAIKYWKYPLPTNILSMEFYPWYGHELQVFENNSLAENLLKEHKLKTSYVVETIPEIETLPGYSSE